MSSEVNTNEGTNKPEEFGPGLYQLISAYKVLINKTENLHLYSNEDFLTITPYLKAHGHSFHSALLTIDYIKQEYSNIKITTAEELIEILCQRLDKLQFCKDGFTKKNVALTSLNSSYTTLCTTTASLQGCIDRFMAVLSESVEADEAKILFGELKRLSALLVAAKFEEEALSLQLIEKAFFTDIKPVADSITEVEDYLDLLSTAKQQHTAHRIRIDEPHQQIGICLQSIDKLVNSLQYHDIVTQKLQHIQQQFQQVVAVLEPQMHSSILLDEQYLGIIPEITSLNIGQLDSIIDEYKHVFRNVASALTDIENATEVLLLANANTSWLMLTNCGDIKSDLISFSDQVLSYFNREEGTTHEFEPLVQALTGLVKELQAKVIDAEALFNRGFSRVHNIKQPNAHGALGIDLFTSQTEAQLTNKLRQINESLEELITRKGELFRRFIHNTRMEDKSKLMVMEMQHLSDVLRKMLVGKKNSCNKLESLIQETNDLLDTARSQAQQLIEELKQLYAFEQQTKELVSLMLNTATQTKSIQVELNNQRKAALLQELGEIYTMDSERAELQQVLEQLGMNTAQSFPRGLSSNAEGGVELF